MADQPVLAHETPAPIPLCTEHATHLKLRALGAHIASGARTPLTASDGVLFETDFSEDACAVADYLEGAHGVAVEWDREDDLSGARAEYRLLGQTPRGVSLDPEALLAAAQAWLAWMERP